MGVGVEHGTQMGGRGRAGGFRWGVGIGQGVQI